MATQKFKLFFTSLGNGITVSNSLKEECGDYQKVAWIDTKGIHWKVNYYIDDLPQEVRDEIEKIVPIIPKKQFIDTSKELVFNKDLTTIVRHTTSICQGEVSLCYNSQFIARYADDMIIRDGERRKKNDKECIELLKTLFEIGDHINNIPSIKSQILDSNYNSDAQ